MKIHNEVYTYKSKKIKKNYTICLLADIHNTKFSRYELWTLLIEKVKEQKPDIIVIAGDMFYDSDDVLNRKTISKMDYLLYGLLNIAPVYLNYGNHDQKDGNKSKKQLIYNYFNEIQDKDERFKLINNDIIEYEDINLIGVTPIYKTYYLQYKDKWLEYFLEALSSIDKKIHKNKFNILITHTPEVIGNSEKSMDKEYKKILDNIDIFLTGHLHDGLIPRFLQKLGIVKDDNGICASEGETLFKGSTIRKINKCRGSFDLYNGKLIVSRGINKWAHPNPFFAFIDRGMSKDMTTIKLRKTLP